MEVIRSARGLPHSTRSAVVCALLAASVLGCQPASDGSGRAVEQAVCSPSRTSLMTGLRPDSTRIYDLSTHFRSTVPEVITLPQALKQAGYHAEWWELRSYAGISESGDLDAELAGISCPDRLGRGGQPGRPIGAREPRGALRLPPVPALATFTEIRCHLRNSGGQVDHGHHGDCQTQEQPLDERVQFCGPYSHEESESIVPLRA